MTARKQLTNKARVLRKYPEAYAHRWPASGVWVVRNIGISAFQWQGFPTPALAWAAAARVM